MAICIVDTDKVKVEAYDKIKEIVSDKGNKHKGEDIKTAIEVADELIDGIKSYSIVPNVQQIMSEISDICLDDECNEEGDEQF